MLPVSLIAFLFNHMAHASSLKRSWWMSSFFGSDIDMIFFWFWILSLLMNLFVSSSSIKKLNMTFFAIISLPMRNMWPYRKPHMFTNRWAFKEVGITDLVEGMNTYDLYKLVAMECVKFILFVLCEALYHFHYNFITFIYFFV